MSELEIPKRAVDAAQAENTAGLKSGEAELVRLKAAGPIIVANRLRQLADDYARRADQIDVRSAAGTFVRNAFLRCAELTRADADELDPGGGL